MPPLQLFDFCRRVKEIAGFSSLGYDQIDLEELHEVYLERYAQLYHNYPAPGNDAAYGEVETTIKNAVRKNGAAVKVKKQAKSG